MINPGPEDFFWRSMELPDELLVGAIDSHVHAGPVLSSNPGHTDPIEIAVEARAAGMRAIVYYDVFGGASGTAWMVNRHVPGIRTYGGYLMNSGHGGLNPRAIKTALHIEGGCRMISFGSHCTYHQASREATVIDGQRVPLHQAYPKFAADELSRAVRIPTSGTIPEELAEILELVAERPEVYLNTGHVSHDEVFRIVELAAEYKIAKVLVAHPARGLLSIDEQRELAARGVFLEGALVDIFATGVPLTHYYVEREYIDRGHELPQTRQPVADYFETLRAVGPEHIVLGTDYGVRNLPTAVQGMRTWITLLLDYGFSTEQIRHMTAENPARLIGIDQDQEPARSRIARYPEPT
ncbi:DUF6282 family protein [Microlunatus parietis]|uniref:Amidohydrolase family protein n=1 Tax=Microlunatus parietis TaxID=682979 RepID=A0A7Y9LD36_9ACTN|nr:DUF6282 family protein [Microlunatus parietis]NYE72345.1 hypothetical protein [Microlunatus parietis]